MTELKLEKINKKENKVNKSNNNSQTEVIVDVVEDMVTEDSFIEMVGDGISAVAEGIGELLGGIFD